MEWQVKKESKLATLEKVTPSDSGAAIGAEVTGWDEAARAEWEAEWTEFLS